MTADGMGGCYSTVPDYTPTVGCYVWTTGKYSFEMSSMAETYGGATSTVLVDIPHYVESVTKTHSTTFRSREQHLYTGISYIPMVTLVHHPSDLQATATGNGTAATSSPTSTSNAAGRLAPRASAWDGLGAVLGVSVAAVALGAAIIF